MDILMTLSDTSGWTKDTWINLDGWNPKKKLGSWFLWDNMWVNLLAYEPEGYYTKEPFHDGEFKGWRLRLWDKDKKKPAFYLYEAPSHMKDHNLTLQGLGYIINPRNPAGQQCFLNWVLGG